MSGWTMYYPKEVQISPDYVLDTRTGLKRYTGRASSDGYIVGGRASGSTTPGTGGMSDAQLESLMSRADPFASQRAGYQEQLRAGMTSGDPYGGWGQKMQSLMSGDFSATDPSYKWRYEQGLQATQRAGAAKGLGASGNEMLALQEAGQGMASQEYSNQFNRLYQLMGQSAGQFNATMDRLANLSGAQFSPAASSQLAMQKYGIDVGAQTSRYTADLAAQSRYSSTGSSGASGHRWVDPYAGQAAERGMADAMKGYVPAWQRDTGNWTTYTNGHQASYSSPPQSSMVGEGVRNPSMSSGLGAYSSGSPFVNDTMPDFSNVQSGYSSSGGD